METLNSLQLKVVELILVFHCVTLDLRALTPLDVILHLARNMSGRIGDNVGSYRHVALLNELDCVLSSLCKLVTHKNNSEASPAEIGNIHPLALVK